MMRYNSGKSDSFDLKSQTYVVLNTFSLSCVTRKESDQILLENLMIVLNCSLQTESDDCSVAQSHFSVMI